MELMHIVQAAQLPLTAEQVGHVALLQRAVASTKPAVK